MDLPAVQLLCMDQDQQSVVAHTQRFQQLACLTNFPYRSLCTFYLTSLNVEMKARLSGVSPWGKFAEFVEWVLENSTVANTICTAEDSSPTPTDLEPSQPSSYHMEWTPESPADRACCNTQTNLGEGGASPGAWVLQNVWPGVWTANIVHHRGSPRGVPQDGMEPHPHFRHWGWAATSLWTS